MTSSVMNTTSSAESYTDFSGLNAIRSLGRADKSQALGEISKQFESMMVRMMMKSMRSANEVFAEGNMLSSNEGDMYQDMFDDQLALSLSKGRGMGIADIMVSQLRQRYGTETEDKAVTELSAYLNKRKMQPDFIPGINNSKNETAATAQKNTAQKNSLPDFDGSPEQFVERLYGMADKAAEKLGVKPEVLMAQAALETGWGKKITGHGNKSSFNLFNIKADRRWQGDTVTESTIEVRNGTVVREMAVFRAYDSPQQSFDDYVEFISSSPRYELAMKAQSSEQYIRALSDAGYATDPDYSDKVMRIVNTADLQPAGKNSSKSN